MAERTESVSSRKLPRRLLGSLLASLSAGVVPRSGAAYIAIGRNDEIAALSEDLDLAAEGGGSMRFLIGKYGSGKSFLLHLMRDVALERGFVTADCDLSPERRFCGAGGCGIATYRELTRNLATSTCPDGGALPSLLAKWLSGLRAEIASEGISPDSPAFDKALNERVHLLVREMEGQVGGFDFARVILTYFHAYTAGDEDKISDCLRYFRGEFATRSGAKEALRVGSIIDDGNWFDYVKLLTSFVRALGYKGLAVFFDECGNLYKIPSRVSRDNNYEILLGMFNDSLGARCPGLALFLGGTPRFLEDPRRGLYSYEALRSRLSEGRLVGAETSVAYKNYSSPVIRLRRMSSEELLALLQRLTILYGEYYGQAPRVTDEQREGFLRLCLSRVGAEEMLTPRELLREYLTALNILRENSNVTLEDLLPTLDLRGDKPAGDDGLDDGLPEVRI